MRITRNIDKACIITAAVQYLIVCWKFTTSSLDTCGREKMCVHVELFRLYYILCMCQVTLSGPKSNCLDHVFFVLMWNLAIEAWLCNMKDKCFRLRNCRHASLFEYTLYSQYFLCMIFRLYTSHNYLNQIRECLHLYRCIFSLSRLYWLQHSVNPSQYVQRLCCGD